MDKETEKILREIQKIFSEEQDKNEKFPLLRLIEGENSNDELDANDYLQKAKMARTSATATKFAKKALELDPTLIEAELILLINKSKKMHILQSGIEELLKKEEKNLKKQKITEKEDAGDYYQILETRPYVRVYKDYIDLLITQGKMRKAVEACCKLCYLNESDNLGTRYTLIALYAFLEEPTLAEELYKKYQEESSFMLLPMIALYYKLDDNVTAKKYLEKLCKNNKNVKKALTIFKEYNNKGILNEMFEPYYSPGFLEELIFAFIEGSFLYNSVTDFLNWIQDNIPKRSSSKNK